MAMVDALTNIDNPAFSLATSKQLFSQYYAEVNEATYSNLIDQNKAKAVAASLKETRARQIIDEGRLKGAGDKDPGGYVGYTWVPSADIAGEQIQVDPTKASAVIGHIKNETLNFEGSQGYYAKLRTKTGEAMYLRYPTRADFLKDKEDGDLSSDQESWEKLFGKGTWNVERFIPKSRLVELEGATTIPRKR